MDLVDQVKNAGVVGAGGAGFPTHVKLAAQAEWYLANGAECEPLLHKDRELMVHFAADIVKGLALAARAARAGRVVIGLKEKHQEALAALRQAAAKNSAVEIKTLGDFYPAGDEYELVYSLTGRLIPPQGIPLNIGVVVNNVETLYNIAQAAEGRPVTEKFLTVAGLVKNPVTTRVPLGMSMRDALELAGGPTIAKYAVMDSGLMMGRLVRDLGQPVLKTTGGLIVLPAAHNIIMRYGKTQKAMDRIGQSACDQCTYCTYLCPRYLLGYNVQPHLVMRSLGFTAMGAQLWNGHALLCCRCGLCTLFACPEILYPREACIRGMDELKALGKGKWEGAKEVSVHPMKEFRRVPISVLMNRLGVTQYEAHTNFVETDARPRSVVLSLRQHVGAAATPVVKPGDRVQKGDLIADIPPGQLGAKLHASIEGRVTKVDDKAVTIERN